MVDTPMDIWSPIGSKVMVTESTATNGMPYDEEKVKKYLKIGQPYTIKNIVVYSWSTDVVLKEVNGQSFNSVNFVNVAESEASHD